MKKNNNRNRIFVLTAICFLALSCACLASCSMKIEPAEPEAITGTAEEVIEAISHKAFGTYNLVVTGELDEELLGEVCDAIRNITPNGKVKVPSLDLSATTGLTDITSDHFFLGFQTGIDKLESIKLPGTITTIHYAAFHNCEALKEITIPASVTWIGSNAFAGCKSLKAINVEEGNTKYRSIDGLLYSKDGTVCYIYPNGKPDSSYAIKEGTITLDNIFYEQRITQLNKLIIPASVQKIEGYFGGCDNLLFEVESENPYFSSKDGALYNKEQTKIFYWPAANGDIYLNGISVIGNYCFYNNERITSLTLLSPVGGTVIGSCAFMDCWNLSSVDLGGTKEIGFGSFETCNLESVTIPASTERIGSYAFYNNPNLSSVIFADTEGWHVTTSSSYTDGDEITVTNSSQNATKLKSSGDWYNKYLYKTTNSSGGEDPDDGNED